MSGDERNNPNPDMNDDFGLAVEEAKPRLKKPPLYRVLLLNDDYTPMEFVVEVLELIFTLDREQATRVMLEVHTKGKGICGVFTYEIAETAAWLVWKLLGWGVLGPPVGLKIAVWFDCKLLSVVMYRLIK